MITKFAKWFQERRLLGVTSDAVLVVLLIIAVGVGPFFVFPVAGMAVLASKGYFFVMLAFLMLLVCGVSILKQGKITVTKNAVFKILGVLLIVEFLGAIFSPAFGMSFFGYGFETTSFVFLLTLCVTCVAAYATIRSNARIGMIYGAAILGSIVVILVNIVRFLVGASHITFRVLMTTTATLVGSWSDLGIILGFVVMFCMITLELGGLRKGIKMVLAALAGVALACLAFMDLRTVWIILGFLSLLSALYIFSIAYWDPSSHSYNKHRSVPWYALAVVVISVACIFFGPALNSLASKHQDISSSDIRLSDSSTMRVGFQSITHNPITGYGPNTFSNVWNLAKPPAISGTDFASTTFSYGSGYLPTELATNGILGIIAWLALIVIVLFVITKKLLRGFDSSLERYLATLLSFGILFLLAASWFLVAGSYLLILLAILLGSFLALDVGKNSNSEETTYSFMSDPRASFFGILGITVLILAVIFAGYVEGRKIAGAVHAVRGSNAELSNNLDLATTQFALALAYAPSDQYDRELSALTIEQVNQLASTITQTNRDQVTTQAESILGTALGYAQAATAINPADYENWIAVGDVYKTLAALGVADSGTQAQAAYAQAKLRDPHDPAIFLSLAELDMAQNDSADALSEIAASINYYPTPSAYILRAQIQAGTQDFADAIISMEAAVALDPYNATTVYQLGLLFYGQGDYTHAIAAFKQAIIDNRSFGLAYGYLGVSYEKSGDITDADAVYKYMEQQSSQADALIAQIKNGSASASAGAAPSTVTPTTPQSAPAAKVAPTPKKK